MKFKKKIKKCKHILILFLSKLYVIIIISCGVLINVSRKNGFV